MALADLQAQIADDLARPDLSSQIQAAIVASCNHFADVRFYFNETRDVTAGLNPITTTFTLNQGQTTYTVNDNAAIPLWFDIDNVFLIVTSTQIRTLRRADQATLEYLIANSGNSQGEPRNWAWFNQALWFYPVPNKPTTPYTIRINGAYLVPAPTQSTDAVSPWITEASELIRCYAKGLVYLHTMHDPEKAAEMIGADGNGGWAAVALNDLLSRGQKVRGFGRITPTEF